jgi:branched-chain amino acid aminotransferase
MNEIGEFKVT